MLYLQMLFNILRISLPLVKEAIRIRKSLVLSVFPVLHLHTCVKGQGVDDVNFRESIALLVQETTVMLWKYFFESYLVFL